MTEPNTPPPDGGRSDRPDAVDLDARGLLSAQRLACGASVDDILEQVADGHAGDLTAHQTGCPHCQAALREFSTLWDPVRQAAATPMPTPKELGAAVMQKVRRLVKDVWYTLELTEGGSIQVAARVVAKVARDEARRVPRVRVVLGRSSVGKMAKLVEKATLGHKQPHSAVGVLGRTAVVDLAVAVTYGDHIDSVAREVQDRVVQELRANIGLKTVTVNVTVDDVLLD